MHRQLRCIALLLLTVVPLRGQKRNFNLTTSSSVPIVAAAER
jgi:hypothetical protein